MARKNEVIQVDSNNTDQMIQWKNCNCAVWKEGTEKSKEEDNVNWEEQMVYVSHRQEHMKLC